MRLEHDDKIGVIGEALCSFLDPKKYRVTLRDGWYDVVSWHWFFGTTDIMSISNTGSTVLMYKAQRVDGCRIIESLETLTKKHFVVKFYEDCRSERESIPTIKVL